MRGVQSAEREVRRTEERRGEGTRNPHGEGRDNGGLLHLPLTRLAFAPAAPSVAIVAMGWEEGWEEQSSE